MPEKYHLGGYATCLVVPMGEEQQTLMNENMYLLQDPNCTFTVFTKLMNEPDEIEILCGKFFDLWAYCNDGHKFGYHSNWGSIILVL